MHAVEDSSSARAEVDPANCPQSGLGAAFAGMTRIVMNFLRSRSEQLADYLSHSIARAELVEPLPGMRDWAVKLGVSYMTLESALKIVERRGLVSIEPRRGVRLRRVSGTRLAEFPLRPKVARVIYNAHEYPGDYHGNDDWFAALSQRLQQHDIHLTLERGTNATYQAMSQKNARSNDLLFLGSLSATQQRLIMPLKHRVILLGEPAPGIPLPFLSADFLGVIRHATHTLLRRGFSKISLIIKKGKSGGSQLSMDMFRSTCAAWPHQPIHATTAQMPLGFSDFPLAARKFASSPATRHGVIVLFPIPVGAIITALLSRGILIPGQTEIVAILSRPESVNGLPLLSFYPFPMKAFLKAATDAAIHFFETGTVGPLKKTIQLETTGSSRDT